MPQCTYYAWSRFYQVYGFSSGAFGNGKDNAREIVAAHPDKFTLSNMPSGGAVFSAQANTLYPEFGHVGFVEAFDGTNLWISEGNYTPKAMVIMDTSIFTELHFKHSKLCILM